MILLESRPRGRSGVSRQPSAASKELKDGRSSRIRQSGASPQPRCGFIEKVGTFLRSIGQRFSTGPPTGPRLPPDERTALLDKHAPPMPRGASQTAPGGRLTPEQTRIFAALLERAPSAHESELRPLGRYQVNEQFMKDFMRCGFSYLIQGGSAAASAVTRPLHEVTSSQSLTMREQHAEQVFTQLVDLYEGDVAKAQAATLHAHQEILAPLFMVCANTALLTLPDGRSGSVLADGEPCDQSRTITFAKGANGRPRLDVEYQVRGRARFLTHAGTLERLSSDSHLHLKFSAEVAEDGTLALLDAPSCHCHLRLGAPLETDTWA